MTHPITPPSELVQQWFDIWQGSDDDDVAFADFVAVRASQYGADQELEACCHHFASDLRESLALELRAARRPKPPSLAEDALEEINLMEGAMYSADLGCDFTATRRALERLQELEGANG